MARNLVTPRDEERAFLPHELFFSTTDAKGFIQYGNDVFVRVSGYTREQLIGQPHNVIRHPHMPRVVFWLLWETILAGKPIAAYVKNMAADGRYYWVLAVVTPIAGGFLSIRLKPNSSYFPVVEKLYKELRQIEAEVETAGHGVHKAMDASRTRFAAALKSLGFDCYGDLMQRILIAEVSGRKQQLIGNDRYQNSLSRGALTTLQLSSQAISNEVQRMFSQLGSVLALEKVLAEQVAFIEALGRGLQLLSLNAQICSASLRDGKTLRVVSEQMTAAARAISGSTVHISKYMAQATGVLREAAFLIAMSDLSVETMATFLQELAHGTADADIRRGISQLTEVVTRNLTATYQQAEVAANHTQKLEQRLDDLIKQIRTLEILHITGKVEATYCGEAEKVSLIFEEVRAKTHEARLKLTQLIESVAQAHIVVPQQERLNENLAQLRAA